MRKKINLIITLILIMIVTFGCGKKEELQNNITSSLADIINEGEVGVDECPEGYVYDYQVSMEPIPEGIAALGGDVCGTIHAYPTRIKIALTKQEIENDPEFQEQNEKNIDAINKYLTSTYGGEFEIEPIRMRYEYMCTEKSTGKKFVIFVNPLFEINEKKNVVLVDRYYYSENAEKYEEIIEMVTDEVIEEEYVFESYYESGESLIDGVLDVYISIFTDVEVDYIEEQKRIIQIYDSMKEIQRNSTDTFSLRLVITYFPREYKDVITTQYNSQCQADFTYIINERAETLIHKGEVWAQFAYSESAAWNDENNLDKIVEDDEYDIEKILTYWR